MAKLAINYKKKTYPIYIYYKEYTTGGGAREGEEDEEWPNLEDEYTEFSIDNISLIRFSDIWRKEEILLDWEPKNGQTVYVLVVRYSSGNTFGNSFGNFHFVGVFKTEQEVLDHQKLINSSNYEGYKPWVGYFERLEHYEIYEGIVGEKDNYIKRNENDPEVKRLRIC
jgi:hypothetical protein